MKAERSKSQTSLKCVKSDDSNSEEKAAVPPAVPASRYQFDVEQALAMRMQMERAAANRVKTVSEDINLALQGLDEAETLRERGDMDAALRLYQLALEVMISRLKSNEQIQGVDRESLEARIHVALSDAEAIKRRIKPSGSPPSKQQQPAQSSRESAPKPGIRSLTERLTAAVASSSSSSSTKQVKGAPQVKRQPQATLRRQKPANVSASQGVCHTHQVATRMATSQGDELRQSVLRELFVSPNEMRSTKWDDIAGLENVKQALQETAILPLMRPDLFTGLRRPHNILLYGPPGTGKTMLVRAVASESECCLFMCTASSMTSKWMGDSEKLVKTLFHVAREAAPSIIFIDEVDSLLSARKSEGEHEASRRLKTEFMVQMDGMIGGGDQSQNHVLVLACTNCPWDVDSAVLRRFPRRIYVPLPDESARRGLIHVLLKKAGKHSINSRQISSLAKRLEGFSCSDITALASEASFGPLRSLGDMKTIRGVNARDVRPMDIGDFENALKAATKSVGSLQLKRYADWQKEQAVN